MNQVADWSLKKVLALTATIAENPEHFTERPLKHYFAEGVYVREMFMHAGDVVVGKVHLKSHVLISLGDLHVYTQAGRAHFDGIHVEECKVGSQRVLAAREDSWIFTVHPNPTNTREIDELERVLVSADLALIERFAEGYLS